MQGASTGPAPARKPPRSLAVNATANATRVALGAVSAVVSTAVVTRHLTHDEYGAWGLVIQLASYFFLFDVGLTLAVSRAVAVAAARDDDNTLSPIVTTAATALAALAAVGGVGVAVAALLFRRMFPTIPEAIVPDARLAFVLVAAGLLAGLPSAAVTGYFNGMRRSHVPAAVAFGVRLVTTIGVITVALAGGGILGLGVVLAVFSLLGGVVLGWLGHRDHHHLVAPGAASWAMWRHLRAFSTHAFLYALATFAIVNLDAVLVAHFDYPRLGAYVIGASVTATLGATHYAAVSAVLPVVAELRGPERDAEAEAVTERAARYSTIFVTAVTAPILVGATPLLRVWVGDSYASSATAPLRLLIVASVIRWTGAVLTHAYFGVNERWPVTIAVGIEAAVNLAASLVLGHRYGAPGVALGTLVGAGAGVIAYLGLAARFTMGFTLPRAVARGAGRPALGFIPVAVTAPWWYHWVRAGQASRTAISLVALAVTAIWLATCLSPSDRQRLKRLVRR